MLDWLQQKIGQRSSHPMNSPAEAARLLAELPLDEPIKAVEEVAAWLESLASATSFSTASRLKVISMVDEAGQPCAELLLAEYLEGEARGAAGRFKQWQVLSDFWERLADAYQLVALQIEISQRGELTEQTTLVVVRGMRAVATQMRLGFMRYSGETGRLWKALYHLYSLAHAQRRAGVPVRPYPWDTASTTARLELVRAVMLESAAPQSLPPREIELTARIAARLAGSFGYGEAPAPALTHYLDLAQSNAPAPVTDKLQPSATLRFFGPGTTAVRVKEMLDGLQGLPGGVAERFGDEFKAAEKIEVLKRLQLYWSDQPPRRVHARARLNNNVDVVFGLGSICSKIGRSEPSMPLEASEKFDIDMGGDEAPAEAPAASAIETWKLTDISLGGLGATTPRRAHGALKIGALMAFRIAGTDKWSVGIVRRLQADAQKLSRVGAEIFSKAPQLLQLKKLGYRQDEAWNWEVRDQKQKSLQVFTDAVLLPPGGGQQGSLLFAPESYFPEESFGVMIDKQPRKLQVADVLEKGDGFERVAFQWLAADSPPRAGPTSESKPTTRNGGLSNGQQE